MIIFPALTFGRGPIYRGPANYAAMAADLVSDSDPVITDLHYRVSANGRRWYSRTINGDLALHNKSGVSELGAFLPTKMIRAFSTVFVFGRLWDDPNNSRAAVFKLSGGEWNRITTPIDGTKGSSGNRYFADAAVESGNLVLLCNSGERTISTNGTSFTGYANIGFTGQANAIVAGTGVVVAAGAGGQGFSAAAASGVWTARNLQLGSGQISLLRAGNVLVAAGNGLSTSALNSGTSWTAQTDPVGGSNDWLEYGNGRWFMAGPAGKWITSTLGATWNVPSETPLSGDRVRSGFWDGTQWVLFLSAGVVGVSEDNEHWTRISDSGLAAKDYVATAKLAA